MKTGAGVGRLSGCHAIEENMDWNVPGVVVGRRREVRVGGVHTYIGHSKVGLEGGVYVHDIGERGKSRVGERGGDATLALVSEVRGAGEGAKDV